MTARALGLAERLQGSGRLDFQEQDWDSELESDSDIGASLYRQFDALLEETLLDFEVGDRVSGEVLSVDQKGAFVNVGGKSPAYLPALEYSASKITDVKKCIKVGIKRQFQVIQKFRAPKGKRHALTVSLKEVELDTSWRRLQQAGEERMSIVGRVIGNNGGGLSVNVMGINGFCPGSHVPLEQKAEGLEGLIGQTMSFTVLDIEKPKLVLSARSVVHNTSGLASAYKVGDVIEGTVQSMQLYGAFLDLGGGLNGLLHVSQISHEMVSNVSDVLSVGNKLKVMVLTHDVERGRLSLSTRKLEPSAGDMIRNPQLVYDSADRMAEEFKQKVAMAEAAFANGSGEFF